ncbi:major facilitator superfamily protein [Actinidia rufa]|uniref:Major facilitator superfamily protein n=1 Tax=Actinidia rufa TaxID=165716 RepID=A0A7J0GDN9_9ERIC|nr:major facilitator superfamily protein [Actinidia rufa]
MGIEQYGDIENGEANGLEDLEKPFIEKKKVFDSEEERETRREKGSIGMVLLSTAVAVCGSFEFGSCVGYSAPTQSAIREDLHLSLAEYSMFGSILTIGAMIGAITSGRVSDSIGRKGAMRISAVSCITGWLAVYFSMGALFLDVGRFLTGYGVGIFSFLVPVFIAEIAPKNLRGGLTTLNQLMIVSGSSIAFSMGTIITWRTLALTGLLPCIALLIGLFFIPESPRWLAKVGKEKEFEAALHKLRGGKDAYVSREAAEIQAYIETLKGLPKAQIKDLFDRKYIRSVTIGVGLMVLQQFGGINGIGFYASETFVAAGLSSGNIGTLAYAIIQVPIITIIGAILMDKSGRRPLLMVSASGTFIGCFLTATSFFLKGQSLLLGWVPILAVSGVLIYIASFSIGMGAVPWVIMSEIFPIHVKGVAGSLVVLVNWLGAWAVSYTFNFLMSWSSTGTFLFYSAFCALTVLFVARVVPETKGKTLEEIQDSINTETRIK